MRAIRIEDELIGRCAQVWGAECASRHAGRIQERELEGRKQLSEIVLQVLPFAIELSTSRARRYVASRKSSGGANSQ